MPYTVIINNTSSDDLVDLTISYYQNVWIKNGIMTTGPFTKGLGALPAGEAANFDLCPCINMASNYAVSFVYEGQPANYPQNVDQLNQEEKQQYGEVDFCGDTLEVFLD